MSQQSDLPYGAAKEVAHALQSIVERSHGSTSDSRINALELSDLFCHQIDMSTWFTTSRTGVYRMDDRVQWLKSVVG
jgi:hypothetical protein